MPVGRAPPIGQLRNFADVYEWSDRAMNDARVTPDYVLRGHCWCALRSKGDQFIGGAQIVEQAGPRGTHVIRTRWREDLTTRHLFEIAGLRYRVVAVRPDDARRFIELEAELYGDAQMIAAPPVIQTSGWDDGASIWDDGASEPWDRNGP
jgi:hypothetical protein